MLHRARFSPPPVVASRDTSIMVGRTRDNGRRNEDTTLDVDVQTLVSIHDTLGQRM